MKFLKSTMEELKAVTWPTGKKLRKDVGVVIQTTILFSIFFAIVDSGLGFVVKLFAK